MANGPISPWGDFYSLYSSSPKRPRRPSRLKEAALIVVVWGLFFLMALSLFAASVVAEDSGADKPQWFGVPVLLALAVGLTVWIVKRFGPPPET